MKPELFTVGHSNHSGERLLELLRQHGVETVVDVRSSPYSARWPQFNREVLQRSFGAAGLRYVFLGQDLGARRAERECYLEGAAQYGLIAKAPAFQSGLNQVREGMGRFRLALMCAEQDPLECHRAILVCRHLRDAAQINHILADGTIESHAEAEARLMSEEQVPAEDLFASRAELLDRAYDQRGARIAYHEATEPVANF